MRPDQPTTHQGSGSHVPPAMRRRSDDVAEQGSDLTRRSWWHRPHVAMLAVWMLVFERTFS